LDSNIIIIIIFFSSSFVNSGEEFDCSLCFCFISEFVFV
jgi:hypothetical protein